MEDSAESACNPISQGCGPHSEISIQISPTTGGDFHLTVVSNISIHDLIKLISKKLKVNTSKICLLFRDKQLKEGNLLCHGVVDGSKITLLPNIEAGMVRHRSESGIMHALESLDDSQVTNFLCGKAPLNLSMRLGDHVMLIQLQLSTVVSAAPCTSGWASEPTPTVKPATLTQASRNLQHKLRRFSTDVFSSKRVTTRKWRKENVYSGTFTGSLNPALQDRKGRIRKDVATIVHILNDLLCSSPQLRSVTQPKEQKSVGVTDESEASSSSTNDEQVRTKGKVEQLRLVMGQRRQRRHERKQKPYSLSQTDNSDTIAA